MRGDADSRAWRLVVATVRPFPGRSAPSMETMASQTSSPQPLHARTASVPGIQASKVTRTHARGTPQEIEPRRVKRIEKGRATLDAVVDLHGLTQDQARARLTEFLWRQWREHARHVLVITGKGMLGDGILRRQTPEWLADRAVRQIIAGVSQAHDRHGGGGALYVALKHNPG